MRQLRRDTRMNLEQSKRLTRARTLGPATALPVVLSDDELTRLIAVIVSDVNNKSLRADVYELPDNFCENYYKIPLSWFSEQEQQASVQILGSGSHAGDFIDLYLRCAQEIQDFDAYFESLCELHKRRRKYEMILRSQPLPTMLQVSPRSLLEFGSMDASALASWLTRVLF